MLVVHFACLWIVLDQSELEMDGSKLWRPRILLPAAAVLITGGLVWLRSGEAAERAYERLASTEIVVNNDYELEEQEPLPDGFDGRVGRVEASYDGPNDFDVIQVTVYESEAEAQTAWEDHLAADRAQGASIDGPRPPYGQVCSAKNETLKCSVQMYEGVIVAMTKVSEAPPLNHVRTSGVDTLLRAGVKNWLAARGLHLPPLDLSDHIRHRVDGRRPRSLPESLHIGVVVA